ncbi:MAG: phosphatase PAP2 family protein [bacterium]|nr:phosphatase PAP2 family protein [bacterium]
MKSFINKYKHAWILLYFFIYMPWFLLLEKHIVTNYTNVATGLDNMIPFCEWFIIPYLLWFGYIALTIAYLFFTSPSDYYKCCAFLFIGMTICLTIYTVWPNGQNLRPTTFTRDNFMIDLVKQIYASDTSTNVCPSIHVFNSIGVHIAISRNERLKKHKGIVMASLILTILISLSTVFLKQHAIFDVVCSVALSIVMYVLVYKVDYVKLRQFIKAKNEEPTT